MSTDGDRHRFAVALWVLAAVSVLWFLRAAADLLVPIALAVLGSYALEPVVAWCERRRLPRLVGAPLVVLVALGATGAATYSLLDDAVDVIESLPAAARQARELVTEHVGRSAGAVREAATELQSATGERSRAAAPLVDGGSVIERVVTVTFAAAAEAIVITFLVLFLLIARHRLRQRVIELAGRDDARRTATARIIADVEAQIQRYLLVLVFTSLIVGLLTWLALMWLGVRHPAMWGLLAGAFNSIPYFGPVIVSGGLLVVGLVQGGDLTQALSMAGVSVAVTSLEGWLLTPLLMGKAENMNALTVFVGLMLWTWIWGGWGTILAVPMLVVMKSTADHVPALRPIGRLMAP